MIIEYATKEIRDCVLHDLKEEMLVGKFSDCGLFDEMHEGLCMKFSLNARLYIYKWETAKLRLYYYQEQNADDFEQFYTICNIIDFLKAGAKK